MKFPYARISNNIKNNNGLVTALNLLDKAITYITVLLYIIYLGYGYSRISKDGGLLLLTNGEWIYVATDGKTKKVELSKDLGTSEQYSPNSAQLIGDTVYVGTLWGGIYSFDVK